MTTQFSESHVEAAALAWLDGLGYTVLYGPDLSPDGKALERASYAEVILLDRFRAALAKLNRHLPPDCLAEVVKNVRQIATPSLVEENRRLHRLLVEGVDVEITRADGSIGGDKAWLIDFANPRNNASEPGRCGQEGQDNQGTAD